jgi:AcrR family transcriptional regulator
LRSDPDLPQDPPSGRRPVSAAGEAGPSPQDLVRRRPGRSKRRLAVLEAALAVIAEKGLEETRMAHIGEAAGMSAGHVMYYFPSKAELLMQALKWSEDQFLSSALEEIRPLPTARERLSRLAQLSLPDSPADPAWILWLETWARAPHDQHIARFQRDIEGRWIGALADVIREGQQSGEFAAVDADSFATIFSALIDGLAIRMLGGPGSLTRERIIQICDERIEAELLAGRKVSG